METTAAPAAVPAAAPAEPASQTAEPDDQRRESVAEELRDAIRRKLEASA